MVLRNLITVRAKSEKAFEKACSGKYTYGHIDYSKDLVVAVKLGDEVEEYIPNIEKHPKTRYKCFYNCDVKVANSYELLSKQIYILTFTQVKVVLIY